MPSGAEPERVSGGRVTPSFFRTASARPALGRYFLPGEDRPGKDRVAVLSHPLWERMGADPGVLGSKLWLNGVAHTVVGVTPREYTLTPLDEAAWVPLGFTAHERNDFGSRGRR